MTFDERETQYILNAVMKQPLIEALPLFLKMTNQRLVPVVPGEEAQKLEPDRRAVKRVE